MNDASYEQRKLALIEEITAAFDGVSRADGVSLSEAWVIDDWGGEAERAKARRQDTETKWQDVPDEDIRYGYSCLTFLDEIGFHYYIPAYIVWYLRYIDSDVDSNTFEWLFYALGAGGGELDEFGDFKVAKGKLNAFESANFKVFTPEQSRAIAHFLVFEQEREEARVLESEAYQQESMSNKGFSQEEIAAAIEVSRLYWREHDLHRNARQALERYWGQFI